MAVMFDSAIFDGAIFDTLDAVPTSGSASLVPGVWTQITGGDVSSLHFQNAGINRIWLLATVGAVAPTSTDGAIIYDQGEEDIITLAVWWPGIPGATRVYAWADEPGELVVSHA